MKKYWIYSLLCFCMITNLLGQVGKKFWFAAPEVTQAHSDRPILLQLSSNGKSSIVTISLPANSSFIPIVVKIPINELKTVDLTSFIDEIENTDFDKPTNKGILIEATEEITAYYEVRGMFHGAITNTDIFILKGQNALGIEFYVPFQNKSVNNINHYGKDGWSSIDVVATEDNTKIEFFYPKHIKTITKKSILLNKGQTYSFRALGQEVSDHLYGARIISTKPIAVTMKDDSVMDIDNFDQTIPPSDLIGDQLIPTHLIGKQYIVSDGTVYLLATQNNTNINVEGISYNLSAGEQVTLPIGGDPVFIDATVPIYVLHIIDKGEEYGGAIVPSIDCSGSRKISFSYPTGNGFEATILVKKGGENDFFINGIKSKDLLNENFEEVPNTNGKWLHLHTNLSELKEGQNTIENKSQEFHLSIKSHKDDHHRIAHPSHGITPDVGNGAYHGYLSNFGGLDLLNDVRICQGDENGKLTILAGGDENKYEWSTGDTTSFITFSTQNIIKDSLIFVKRIEGQCQVIDTMTINIGESVKGIDLGEDLELCEGDTHLISLPTKYFYKWNNGDSTENYTIKKDGLHKVVISTQDNCTFQDSLFSNFVLLPIVDLGNDTLICNKSSISLNVLEGYHSYQWNTGETNNSIQISQEGTYSVKAITQTKEKICGIAEDQIQINFWDVHTYNIITPNGDGNNDVFVVEGIEKGTWMLEVYNRWGKRVYYDKQYKNTWSPEGLNEGIYFFNIKEENEAFCNQFHNWLQIVK